MEVLEGKDGWKWGGLERGLRRTGLRDRLKKGRRDEGRHSGS